MSDGTTCHRIKRSYSDNRIRSVKMQYFDLPEISADLLKKLGISNFNKIKIKPDIKALPQNCLNNVVEHIQKNGGDIQFGWIFSCIGNIAIKMTAHAVVKQVDGSLVCVTPNEFHLNVLKFAPDDSIINLIKNNFLPTRFVPLVNDPILEKYLEIEREQDQLRLDYNGVIATTDLQRIQMKASLLYSEILALSQKHTGRNDCCYCGSGKKRKKCCG